MKKPCLKKYYSVRFIESLENQAVSITLGNSDRTSKHIEGPSWLSALLNMLDGKNSVSLILDKLSDRFKISIIDIKKAINELIDHDLLFDQEGTQKEILKNDFLRYERHLLYYSIFHKDSVAIQKKLSRKTVCILGVGGIGCWTSLQLAAAGVGELILVDHDAIELSNLTRQILFRERDIGKKKIDVAREALLSKNHQCKIRTIDRCLKGSADIRDIIRTSDLVIFSADKPAEIHGWMNEASFAEGVPFLTAGYIDEIGVVGPLIIPGKTPCLSCMDDPVPSSHDIFEDVERRLQVPSFGPLNGWVASITANEAIKYLTGYAPIATDGRMVEIDPITLHTKMKGFPRKKDCSHCGGGQRKRFRVFPLQEAAQKDVTAWFNRLIDENVGIVERVKIDSNDNVFLDQQLENIRKGKLFSFILSDGGKIIGKVDLRPLSRECDKHVGEISFGLLKGYPEAGVDLLAKVESAARRNKIHALIYYILEKNSYFQEIFLRSGFSKIGSLPNFYRFSDGDSDHRVIFHKQL